MQENTGIVRVNAEIRLPWMDVSIRTHSWDEVTEQDHFAPGPHVYMLLSPWPKRSRAAYRLDTQASQYNLLGDVFLTPPDLPLHFRSALGQGLRIVRCRFDRLKFEEIGGLKSRWQDSVLNRCFDIRSVAVSEALMRLAHEAQSPGAGSEFMIEALGMQIAVEVTRYFSADAALGGAKGRALTARQMRIINHRVEDIAQGLPTVPELATLCDMSSRHLLRLFRNTTGHTISEYIEEMRLKKAKALLSSSEMPLKEIAYRLAFSAPSSFSVAFRKATGTTPLSFRRQFST
jgi:AraC family transcriptional regulator